ncbi:MAG: hypothetical protein F6K26_31870 [Moorea sp. SIO2I5]|nr:hypothetical protein [Moorena sp. SIO2I5]
MKKNLMKENSIVYPFIHNGYHLYHLQGNREQGTGNSATPYSLLPKT